MRHFWLLFYKFYNPKTRRAIVSKWERLDYFDFSELQGVSK